MLPDPDSVLTRSRLELLVRNLQLGGGGEALWPESSRGLDGFHLSHNNAAGPYLRTEQYFWDQFPKALCLATWSFNLGQNLTVLEEKINKKIKKKAKCLNLRFNSMQGAVA